MTFSFPRKPRRTAERLARWFLGLAGRFRLAGLVLAGGFGALAGCPPAAAAVSQDQPCDIYGAARTPCVAAYSTVRALYATYHGPLYRVERSDGATHDIGVRSSGYADAAAQDRFCFHASCEITEIFDQSPKHNNLTIEGPGGNAPAPDVGVDAETLRTTTGGHEAYGMYFGGGMGYRNNDPRGVATGAQPESMYMVTSGKYSNASCCFDFGNAERNGDNRGNGHMDAIYFGSLCWIVWPICYGKGPWVEADMENGLFFSNTGRSQTPSDTGNTNPFVTAMLKNNGTTTFAIHDANAQRGPLTTDWSGPLPNSPYDPNPPVTTVRSSSNPSQTVMFSPPLSGYRPMRKEGAIVLGTGGDGSNMDIGAFFEGVMTAGYPTDATDNAVQANIVSAGYGSRVPRCRPESVTVMLPRDVKLRRVTVNGHGVPAYHHGRRIFLTIALGTRTAVARVIAQTQTGDIYRRSIRIAACTANS
jgi:hypothetical protein